MNCEPQSLTISSSKPKYQNTRLNMSSAVSKVVSILDSGIKQRDLENKSIITRITVFPWEAGRLAMKSRARCDHGCCGVGSGINFSMGRVHVTLDCAHTVQDEINWCMSVTMWGHQYLLWTK